MKNITIITIISLFLVSCGTGWCIKVDGKYGEKSGGFEYCYDPAKGILENAKDATKAVIVTKDELEKIKNEATQVETKDIKKKLIDQLLERMK